MPPQEIPDSVHLLDNGHGVAIIAVWREVSLGTGLPKDVAELRWCCRRTAKQRGIIIRADPQEARRFPNIAPDALSEARAHFGAQCLLCCPEHVSGGDETTFSASTKPEIGVLLLKVHSLERRLLDHLVLHSSAPGLAGMAQTIAEVFPQN